MDVLLALARHGGDAWGIVGVDEQMPAFAWKKTSRGPTRSVWQATGAEHGVFIEVASPNNALAGPMCLEALGRRTGCLADRRLRGRSA